MNHLPELSCDELAVIYSAAILADDDVSITVDKISTILKAANVDVEPIWPALYARALSGVNVRQMLTTVAAAGTPSTGGSQSHLSGVSAGGAPTAGLVPDTAKPVDAAATLKHAQEAINGGGGEGDDEDDDDDLGMSLFDFD